MLSCPRPLPPSRRLDEYADLMVLTGGDPFRGRLSHKAARAITAHPQDMTALNSVARQQIAGAGKSIAAKVGEVNATGSFAELEDLRADIPAGSGS
jgi:DNA polymerase (family 10)